MKSILIVEDDEEIQTLLAYALGKRNYNIHVADNGYDGYLKFTSEQVDLIVTDVMMPKVDGYSLVKKIRTVDNQVPIIMLTALKSEEDELAGFDSGVSDYVSKPFSIEVLVRRIENQLKSTPKQPKVLIDGKLTIEVEQFIAYSDGMRLKLTKKEFQLLVELVQSSDSIVTRERINELLWGPNYLGDSRNMDTHIKNLRRKLGNDQIKTIKGIGYMYEKTK